MSMLKRTAYFLGLPVALIILWFVLTRGEANFFVPTPEELGATFWEVWAGERFVTDFVPSIIRLFIGLIATITLGIVFGVTLMYALRDQGLERISIPFGQLVVFLVLSLLLGVLAAVFPARRVARLDVLRAIATD